MSPAVMISCAFVAISASQYDFVANTDRLVGFLDDSGLTTGKLNESGEFVAGSKQPWSEDPPLGRGARSMHYSGPGFADLRPGRKLGQKVYQFRAGVLVPGVIGPGWQFVNEPGGAIVQFEDYKHTVFSRPIWNLPGRFELVKLQTVPKTP